jgi:branched-chain amino acid transport system substrate-binding protein
MALGAPARGTLCRAVLLVPFACLLLAPGAPAHAAGGPIVIGTSISKTGPLAEDADYQIKGLELAVADANAKGGWLGRKVELKLYDDKSEAGTGVRLYTRLITQDKVDLLIGPYSSGITQAVAPLINKYHFATVEPGASLPDIYVPGNHWNIQGTASSLSYLEPLMPLAQKTYGAKTVAILGLKSAFSLACYNARLEQAKKLGLQVVYQTTYSLPQPDFASIALAIKNANPDVVIGCTYYPDAVGIAQALHSQGFAPKLLAETIGPVEAAFVKALGPVANGIIANTGWWYNFKTPDNAGFIARYKAKFNEEPDYHAASGYAAVEVLGAAVEHTRSLDQTKLRDWLLHNEVPTIQGTFKVDPNGLSIGYGQDMVQVQNGDIKLVWPDDLAQAKLIEPYPGS